MSQSGSGRTLRPLNLRHAARARKQFFTKMSNSFLRMFFVPHAACRVPRAARTSSMDALASLISLKIFSRSKSENKFYTNISFILYPPCVVRAEISSLLHPGSTRVLKRNPPRPGAVLARGREVHTLSWAIAAHGAPTLHRAAEPATSTLRAARPCAQQRCDRAVDDALRGMDDCKCNHEAEGEYRVPKNGAPLRQISEEVRSKSKPRMRVESEDLDPRPRNVYNAKDDDEEAVPPHKDKARECDLEGDP